MISDLFHSDEGLTLEKSAFLIFALYQLLIKPNFCFILPRTQNHSFFRIPENVT